MKISEESSKALVGRLEIMRFGATKYTETLKKIERAPAPHSTAHEGHEKKS
jgi:hypothetical protein